MHVSLLLPGALLPREVIGALQEPLAQTTLATMLARAEIAGDTATDGPGHLAWLAEHLFHRPLPLATGPYAFAALRGPMVESVIWQADPVHLETARDHLVVTPLATAPTEHEAGALLAVANGLAAEAGVQFVRAAGCWFMTTSLPWALQTHALSAAIGRPLQTVMPEGTDAVRWNRLLTEIQMAWHAHPVNEAREARGAPTINSVWLHGGGEWQRLTRTAFSAVLADAPEWRGAAHAASLPAAGADGSPSDDALVIWSDLLVPRQMHDWSRWLTALHGLDERLAALTRVADADLILTSDQVARRLKVRTGDRLRFWRTRSLEQAFAE